MNVRPLVLAALAGALLAVAPAAADGPSAPAWKNLEVLPKDIPKDQLKAMMKAQAKALGVECDFCHEPPDMAKDTKKKEIAREMMRMTTEINAKFLARADKKVGCVTCHQGKEVPPGAVSAK